MPNSFAETPNGLLLVASGMDPMLRWDGMTGQAEIAGVKAPTTQPALSGDGAGSILGTYYAYLRYVDRNGNLSNLSPVSTKYETTARSGNITGVSKTSPIKITCNAHGLLTGTIVKISGVLGATSANGTWIITKIDSDTFSLDGSIKSTNDYQSGGTWLAGVSTISYSNIEVPSDPQIARRQILRNTDGQTATSYVDIDTTDLTSASFTSTKTDSELSAGIAVPLFDSSGDDLAISSYSVPPNYKGVLAHHLDRMFAAVDVEYSEGSVAVSFGSPTVAGIGTEWTPEIKGRSLYIVGAGKAYEITSVDVSDQKLTLAANYESASDPYANYAIRPAPAERRLVYYSESGLPEAWPPTNAISLQEDGDEITGLMPLASFLYILERRHIYRFTYQSDPAKDGFVFLSATRGCINNRCWVRVEGAAYMLDEAGIHLFQAGQSEPLSVPIRGLFNVDPDSPARINWSASRYFHAAHSPAEEVIRWFVALSGHYLPRHALCYDYRQQRWWIEEFSVPIGSSATVTLNGRPHVLLGSSGKRILAYGIGTIDGPDPAAGTVRGTVTSSGLLSIADTAATFASSGVVGSPVVIVSGKGKGQVRRIVSVAGTTLNVDQPWHDLPDTTSTYEIGGIRWKWRSGWFQIVDQETENKRSVELVFAPTGKPATVDVKLYLDHSSAPVRWGINYDDGIIKATSRQPEITVDMTNAIGFAQAHFSGQRELRAYGPRFVSVELAGVVHMDVVTIYQVTLDGVR
jgi:hypothetical protein